MSRGYILSSHFPPFLFAFISIFSSLAFLEIKFLSTVNSNYTLFPLILLLSDQLWKNYFCTIPCSQFRSTSFLVIFFIIPSPHYLLNSFMGAFFAFLVIFPSSYEDISRLTKIYDCLQALIISTHTLQMPSKNCQSVSGYSSK